MIYNGPAAWRHGLFALDHECTAVLDRVDAAVVEWATAKGATPERHPELIPVEDLQRIDYFESFPHLAHRVTPWLTGGDTSSGETAGDTTAAGDGEMVLTSAACYGAYFARAGSTVAQPELLTLRQTCRRQEARYEPLRRQREFQMREVVVVGSAASVEDFLQEGRAFVEGMATEFEISGGFVTATDPFFRREDPRLLHQRVFPTKQEFVDGSGLAIASVNTHRNFFGERCGIRLPDGTSASTGCVAWGLERWADAVLRAPLSGVTGGS